jgi:hypothetical protein
MARKPHPPHPSQHAPSPRERALYDGMPSATNRQWGPDRSNNAYSYGYEGQGGWGDFSTGPAPAHVDRDVQPHGGGQDRGHRAEDIAADASGVTEVRNEIRVDNGVASFGRPGEAVR